ncbi:MAG: SDR family oxidoreductase [Phycisphaerales bacterium]|nr:SDR family oxidoreductase [Phycisphaerales bacterium]
MARIPSRVVLVTGCGAGIGRVTAAQLLSRGHVVCASARRRESVDELTKMFADAGDWVMTTRLDVAEPSSFDGVIDAIIGRFGRLDVLINNAAYGQAGAVEELTIDAVRRQFDVNLFGLLELTQRVLTVMRAAGAGRIINISSVVAHVALPFMGAYNAGKSALNGLTDTMRMELRGSGIDVVLIEPGAIRTSFGDTSVAALDASTPAAGSRYAGRYGRWQRRWRQQLGAVAASPESVARVIVRAVESSRCRARYRVTSAARFGPLLKAVLPDRLVDRLILKMFHAD